VVDNYGLKGESVIGNIVLLSGEPRVGKTTALKKIIQMVGKDKCIGFYTEEICNEFDRIGFDCVSLDGRRRRIADVNFESDVRIGRYGIDINVFEDFAIQAINNSFSYKKIIVIDEIGPIQLLSTKFKQELNNVLTAPNCCVIGTIFYKKHTDIDEIKRIPGIKFYTLTNENRNTIAENIFNTLRTSSGINFKID
jgi:nucleoside-triphosphatase